MKICCPHCLVPFESAEEASWNGIACPTCGNSFSLSGTETTCSFQPGVQVMGRFELLEVVGNGRFGSVWKARDTQLQRMVAVKIPRQGKLNPQETELFLRDARAAAQLRHPRIAGVHEVGREFDTVYIVSDFIDGANLAEWLSGRRLTAEESAELVVEIAEALHHAHEKGVVHRDVKPGNIMMDRNGLPHVIDFGLALREVGEMTVTVEGQVLGTPAYMPPEQARGEGHRADRRSDIYSVGAILFKLLTGELPFRGDARMLLIQILDEEPPSPRKLNANVPRDLETITLKCLEKQPTKRYQTARDLADDLKRYLAGEPILARPVGYIERAWRWSKRHTAVATLSASLLVLLLAVAITAPIVALQQRRLRIDFQNQVAQNRFQRATEDYDAGRIARGIAMLSSAYDLLDPESELRGSIPRLMAGWSRQVGRPLVHDDAVVAVALHPDGRTALVGGHSPTLPARLWDIQTMKPIGSPLKHRDSVRAVAFGPDGRLALTGSQDRTARFWDAHTGAPIGKPLNHEGEVWGVAFSRDGRMVATGGQNMIARLWDTTTCDSIGKPMRHEGNVLTVAFSPDGARLLTGDYQGMAHVWDVKSQEQIAEPFRIGPPPETADDPPKPVYVLAYCHDGAKILSACADKLARFWDAKTLKPIGEPFAHENGVYAASVNHFENTVLTGSFDNTARLWDAESGRPRGGPLRHGDWVMSVAFSRDGRTVMTGSPDRTARLWSIQESYSLAHDGDVLAAGFNSRGDRVASGGEDATARISDAKTHQPICSPLPHDRKVTAVAFSSDGKFLFTGTESGRVQRWNAETGEAIGKPWDVGGVVRGIEHRRDANTVLIQFGADGDDAVQLWDFQTRQAASKPLRFSPKNFEDPFVFVTAPDGRTVIIKDKNESVQMWDAATGERKGAGISHIRRIADAEFSADGSIVVSGGFDQHLRVWDGETGQPIGKPIRHGGIVRDVALSRDARTILSGSSEHTARLWDWRTGTPLGEGLQHSDEVEKVALSPDSRLALTVCRDGSAHLWDVAVGKRIARPLQYEVGVTEGKFNRDGAVILFRCKDGSARLYDVPQALPDNPQFIRAWTRTQTGFEPDDKGVLQQLSQSKWQEAQAELAELERSQ